MDVVVGFVCVHTLMSIIYIHVRTVTELGISKQMGGGGGVVPSRKNPLGLGVVSMPLSRLPYAFVVRVKNEIHIVNNVC